jgi:adenine specific DNA methylase Mod
MNRFYFGDNLEWLSDRKEFPDASVDLIYSDPPFNSNADYNVLFREPSGAVSQAQFHAFTDTWSWADAAASVRCPQLAVFRGRSKPSPVFRRRVSVKQSNMIYS